MLELDAGSADIAIASMVSDLNKHDETARDAAPRDRATIASRDVCPQGSDAVRKWFDTFR